MNSFKDKMARFMYGRYGMDQLSRNLSLICLVLLIVTMFVRNNVIYVIALVGIVYTYFRVFSRNISRRSEENEKYLKFHYKVVGKLNKIKFRITDSKTHRIFRCPSCSQKIRVPRGKGKISIKCPKCRIEFIKKT
jgi:DNA-directed RNA polymerase subunit RPC12/RpoP